MDNKIKLNNLKTTNNDISINTQDFNTNDIKMSDNQPTNYKPKDVKNDIAKLKKIVNEIENRYNKNTLKRYNAGKVIHKKQMQFHESNKRNRWVFGGNRSGKTECGAVEVVWRARGIHPYLENKKNTVGWVVSVSTQVQRDVAQKKILYYLNPDWIEEIIMSSGKKGSPELGIIDTIVVKNIFGGHSIIGFKSCDQGREKFQGASLDYVWFDEEPPYDIYIECKMRIIDKVGDLFGTMTPLKGLTWVYDEIYLNHNNDPNVWHIHMEWLDNPFLNKEEVLSMTQTLSEDEINSRRFGLFTHHGGLVYSDFREEVNVVEPFNVPLEWYDNISIDPGLNNPLSCHWYACDYDGNVYVIAEHYEAKKDVEYHAGKIKEISNKLNWQRASNGNIVALIDSAANQRTLASSKSVSELFYDYGISVNTRVNKDLFSGISRVKSYIKNANGESKLFIFKNCVNLIKEIKGYYWGEADVPVKSNDHALDELRYYIMSRPDPAKKSKIKTLVQKNKERLYKNIKNKRHTSL